MEQERLQDRSRENTPALLPPPVGAHTERWLQTMQSASSATIVPRSFDSIDSPTDETGAKVKLTQEENMKFPMSMKMQRAKPESLKDGLRSQRQLQVPGDKPPMMERRHSGASQRAPSPVPRLITSEEKEGYYLNTDGSSESDEETDGSSSRRSKSPSYGQIITTTSLMAMGQALTLHSGSPSSFRSQNSYFEDASPRSLATRPKQQSDYGTSPRSSAGAIPIPGKQGDRLSASAPRPNPFHLKPDSKGNPIPPEAKWTKINRRLVSPEVLDQAHKRYEAYVLYFPLRTRK